MNLFETNLLPVSGEFKSHRYSLSQCLRKTHSVLGESYEPEFCDNLPLAVELKIVPIYLLVFAGSCKQTTIR